MACEIISLETDDNRCKGEYEESSALILEDVITPFEMDEDLNDSLEKVDA